MATGKAAGKAAAGKTAPKGVGATAKKPQTITHRIAVVTAPSLRGRYWPGEWGEALITELTPKERVPFDDLEKFLPEPTQPGVHSLLIKTDNRGSCKTIYGPKLVNLSGDNALQFGSALYPVTQADTFLYLGDLKGSLLVSPQEKPEDPLKATCVFRGKINEQSYSFEVGVKLAEGTNGEALQGFTISGEPLAELLGAPGGNAKAMKTLVLDEGGNPIDIPDGGYTWNITGFGQNGKGEWCYIYLEDEGTIYATGNSEAQLSDGPIELPCHLVITSCVPAGQGHSVGNRIAPGYAPGTEIEPEDELDDVEGIEDIEDDLDAEPAEEEWREQAEVH